MSKALEFLQLFGGEGELSERHVGLNKAQELDELVEGLLGKVFNVIVGQEKIQMGLSGIEKLIELDKKTKLEIPKEKDGSINKDVQQMLFYNLSKKLYDRGNSVVIEITNNGKTASSRFKYLINKFYGGFQRAARNNT